MVANSKKKPKKLNKLVKQIDLTEFQKVMEDYFVANINKPLPCFGTTYEPPKLNPFLQFKSMPTFEYGPFISKETVLQDFKEIFDLMQAENENPNKN